MLQRLSQVKGERTAGKNFLGGIPRGGLVRQGKMDFRFEQLTIRIPQAGGAPFGYDLQPIVPGALAKRTQGFQSLFEEVEQGGRIVRKFGQFHSDS